KSIIWKFDYTLRNLRDDAYTAFLVEELKAAGYWDKKQWQTEGIRIHPARPAVVFKGGAVTEDWGGGDRFFDAWMDEAPLTGQNALQGKRAYDKVGHSCNLRWTVGTPPPEGMANWWSQLVNPDLAPSVAGSAAA